MRLGGVACLLVLFLVPPASSGIAEIIEQFRNMFETHSNGTDDLVAAKLNATEVDKELLSKRLKDIREMVMEKLEKEAKNSNAVGTAEQKIFRNIALKKTQSHIRATGDSILEVNENSDVAENFYQGDMLLVKDQLDLLDPAVPEEEKREKRQAYRDRAYPSTTWGGTVFYDFDASLPATAVRFSQLAMTFWQRNTCINFVQSATAQNRIRFFQGQGCYSYVGKLGRGAQDLSLGRGCESFDTAAHEIGHALGFFHEQSRVDRDSAITVQIGNVIPHYVDQFDKQTAATNFNYGLPYDYGSIMHYGANSASKTDAPTMVARMPQYQDTMGSAIVSFIDVSMMNDHYGCKARCASSGTVCQNGGFPHPRDCSKCLCPAGYGGDTCTQRPEGCGATLTATATPQTVSGNVGLGLRSQQDDFVYCNWLIQAPAGRRIMATISAYARNVCREGCNYGGVELKWQANPQQTGSRYCCPTDVGKSVISDGNVLPIIGFNRVRTERFSIQYVLV